MLKKALISSRLLIFLFKGILISFSVLLYAWNLINLQLVMSFFVLAEIISIFSLMININNNMVKLNKNYVIADGVFYVLFWISMLISSVDKMEYIFACLPLLCRFGVKLKSYCNCEEYQGENDLEIFFKVICLKNENNQSYRKPPKQFCT